MFFSPPFNSSFGREQSPKTEIIARLYPSGQASFPPWKGELLKGDNNHLSVIMLFKIFSFFFFRVSKEKRKKRKKIKPILVFQISDLAIPPRRGKNERH